MLKSPSYNCTNHKQCDSTFTLFHVISSEIFRMIFLSWNPQTSCPLLAKSSQISLAGPSTSTSSSPFYPEQADRRHGFSQCPFLPLHTQVQVTTPPKCTGWRKNIDVVEVKFFSSLAELIYVEYLFICMSKYVFRRTFWNLSSRFNQAFIWWLLFQILFGFPNSRQVLCLNLATFRNNPHSKNQ